MHMQKDAAFPNEKDAHIVTWSFLGEHHATDVLPGTQHIIYDIALAVLPWVRDT